MSTLPASGQANHTSEVVDLLRRTLDLLAGPTKRGENLAHVEEAHSFTAAGIGCEAWDELAARWSIVGAMAKFSMDSFTAQAPLTGSLALRIRREELFDAAFRYVFAAAILQAPQTVNGVNNRGWDAARDLLEFATLLAENEADVIPFLILPQGRVPTPALRQRLEQIAKARGAQLIQMPS
jgi:hypothetical protein